MGDAPRLGFHSGTRGVAGRDALQRTRRAGTSRMVTELVDRVAAIAGDDGWIVLGGIPRVVARAARALADSGAHVLSLESLDVHASTAQIADAARRGASTLRDASAVRHLDEIAAEASAGGLGVLGREATERALQRASVRTLFLSERFLAEHAADAAALLRSAIDQDASIEEVSRAASRELDTHGGIGALLRFKPVTEVDVPLATANGG
jgi:stalled ribosome rescue protein Dom34